MAQAPQSRALRVNSPNFDREGYDTLFADKKQEYQLANFAPGQLEILHNLATVDPKADQKYLAQAKVPSKQQLQDTESKWHPTWFALPMIQMLNGVQKAVVRWDAPNYIHPFLRRAATPVALAAAAASIYHTDKFCKDAGIDNLTRGYQMAATATYQLAANYALPSAVFALLTKTLTTRSAAPGGRNTAVIYGAAAFAALTAMAAEKSIRFKSESVWMNRRLSRKDYGFGGQSFQDNSIHHDSYYLDFAEHWWTGPVYGANQYVFAEAPGTTEDKAITTLFPGLALAEALPAFEIPINAQNFVAISPFYAQHAMTDNQVEVDDQRDIPAPTPNTMCRECSTKFGEWSLANNWEHAYDKAFGLDWYLQKGQDDNNAIERIRTFRAKYQLKENEVKKIMFAEEKNAL